MFANIFTPGDRSSPYFLPSSTQNATNNDTHQGFFSSFRDFTQSDPRILHGITQHSRRHVNNKKGSLSRTKSIPFVLGIIGIAFIVMWFIRSKKVSTDEGNIYGLEGDGDSDAGEGDVVPRVPEGESLEQSADELERLAFEIATVEREIRVSMDTIRKNFKQSVEAWEPNMIKRVQGLARKPLEEDKSQEEVAKMREEFVKERIIPNINRANPMLTRFACEQMQRVLRVAAETMGSDFTQMANDLIRYDGTKQFKFNYPRYTETMAAIRRKPKDKRSDLEDAVVKIYKNMVPRLVAVNNRVATYLGPMLDELMTLELPVQ